MLAALLCNLEGVVRGPILREQRLHTLKGVEDAARQISQLLNPIPARERVKVKKAIEKAYEYSELPEVSMRSLGSALEETQGAIRSVESLLQDLGEPDWAIELRVVLEQLTLISVILNDDEEALLLLM